MENINQLRCKGIKMAKKFKDHVVRDKPKKRGSRQHKKSLNKNEKRQKRTRRYKGQGKG